MGLNCLIAYLSVPVNMRNAQNSGHGYDWLGSFSSAGGLILLVSSIISLSSVSQDMTSPSVYVPFAFGLTLLVIAIYIEGWIAQHPLLPFSVFRIPQMRSLSLALFFSYGSIGVYLLYATL